MCSTFLLCSHVRRCSYCSLLQNTRIDSARGVSLCRTAFPSLRLKTRPAIASLRTWSEAFSYPILRRSEISSTDSSGLRARRSKICNRRWFANPFTMRSILLYVLLAGIALVYPILVFCKTLEWFTNTSTWLRCWVISPKSNVCRA